MQVKIFLKNEIPLSFLLIVSIKILMFWKAIKLGANKFWAHFYKINFFKKWMKVNNVVIKLFLFRKKSMKIDLIKIEILKENQKLYWKSDLGAFRQLLAWWFFKVSRFFLIWCASLENCTTAKTLHLINPKLMFKVSHQFIFPFSLFGESDEKRKNQLSCLFTFYWESKFLIGQ